MPDPSQVAKVARQWWDKAEADFRAAGYLAEAGGEGGFHEIVAFHAQQAAEKHLKALLVHHQIPFPKSHDCSDLLDRLAGAERNLRRGLAGIAILGPFGVAVRYPGERAPVSPRRAGEALRICSEVRRKVRQALRKPSAISGSPGLKV